jgi:glycosyltransferase involved in cell wall biosynthesis
VEWFNTPVGRNLRHFERCQKFLERQYASDNCRRILTWSETAKQAILDNLERKDLAYKVSFVPLAIHPQPRFEKKRPAARVRLLFVASANFQNQVDFMFKGGPEVVEAVRVLARESSEVELIVRASVPASIRRRCASCPNIKIIDNVLSRSELESEFKKSDVFVQPNRSTPFGAYLEAMSFGLPVVTRDAYANKEIVEDGKTGFVVKDTIPNSHLHTKCGFKMVPMGEWPISRDYFKSIWSIDHVFVERLVSKLRAFIDDRNLSEKMGERARFEVEQGRFSLRNRNEVLKSVLDRALHSN